MTRFDLMLRGGEEGSKWCLRAKMNMKVRPHSRRPLPRGIPAW